MERTKEFISKHLIAKEYQLPIIDKIFEACQYPFDKNPLIGMIGESKSLPGSQKVTIKGMDGNDIDLYIWKPTELTRKGPLPILYFMHGGGYLIGDANTMATKPEVLTNGLQAILVSVNYRLATVAPFPADLHDAYSGLEYIHDHAAEYGADPTRIVILGESAGGGLAARLALYNRDHGRVPLCGQALTYPMLDSRTGSDKDPMPDPFAGQLVWTPSYNQFGWDTLLGGQKLADDQLPYFSASLAMDLSNLPPAFIAVGTLDLFCMSCLDYTARLSCAGVNAEMHTIPGVFHGFDLLNPDSPQTTQYNQLRIAQIKRMFGE